MTPKETSKEVIDELCKILDASPKKYRETMTPKEKAKDLYDSYWYCLLQSNIEKRNYWSQQCALIAVDEIILSAPFEPVDTDWDEAGASAQYWYPQKLEDSAKWWGEVKQEIELL